MQTYLWCILALVSCSGCSLTAKTPAVTPLLATDVIEVATPEHTTLRPPVQQATFTPDHVDNHTSPTALRTSTLQPSLVPSSTPTLPPALPPTESPYVAYTIDALASRSYGGGTVKIVETIEDAGSFARYHITYPSDGLTIHGFMNVPHEGWNFPVAIVLHGYVDPEDYELLPYTQRYADRLAEAGYFVFHPNYRNYPPSDSGPDFFRTGDATDILNLVQIIEQQSQDPVGTLRRVDETEIHLFGHSMGGGIALRVAVIRPESIEAVVLYASMSGNEQLNYTKINEWSDGVAGAFELAAPPDMLAAINPIDNLERSTVPFSVHHSNADQVVPVEWSEDLCSLLATIDHPHECFTYNGFPHTFYGIADDLLLKRAISFFEQH